MVTTATSTKGIGTREREQPIISPLGGRGGGGNGPRGNGGGGGDRPRDDERFRDDRGRLGMWVGLASILMLFTALTSAYIVRAGLSDDWRPLQVPNFLWASTALILASSVTFQMAHRAIKRYEVKTYTRWVTLTGLLGLGFLTTQLLAWRQLVAQGVYLASNPHSSFFYLLTGVHGLHLLGGILGLGYLLARRWNKLASREAIRRRQRAAGVIGLYWHFMDGLWVYLFLLLFLWR
ncbi:MAG: cytochrome c oxidase subunit 3 [Pyrinomonadaceae bacterium]|nr:cytochrome c oxidase subunit 3 [Pyrinomonadaceae bacterium]